MKRNETLFSAIVRAAFLGALLGVILPMFDNISWREAAPRIGIGLVVGALVGAILWLIRRTFRQKEEQAIEQMHAECLLRVNEESAEK